MMSTELLQNEEEFISAVDTYILDSPNTSPVSKAMIKTPQVPVMKLPEPLKSPAQVKDPFDFNDLLADLDNLLDIPFTQPAVDTQLSTIDKPAKHVSQQPEILKQELPEVVKPEQHKLQRKPSRLPVRKQAPGTPHKASQPLLSSNSPFNNPLVRKQSQDALKRSNTVKPPQNTLGTFRRPLTRSNTVVKTQPSTPKPQVKETTTSRWKSPKSIVKKMFNKG